MSLIQRHAAIFFCYYFLDIEFLSLNFQIPCIFPVWNYFSPFSLFSLWSGNPVHTLSYNSSYTYLSEALHKTRGTIYKNLPYFLSLLPWNWLVCFFCKYNAAETGHVIKYYAEELKHQFDE